MGRYLQSYTKPCIAAVIAAMKMRNQFVFMRYHVNGCVRVNVRTLTVFLFQRFFLCVFHLNQFIFGFQTHVALSIESAFAQ